MMIWFRDRLRPAVEVAIDPTDRGFTLGDGLFETIACRDGVPRHVDAHLARLAAGAHLLDLPLPLSATQLAEALTATLVGNSLGEASLRLTLTRGPGPRGVPPPPCPTPTLLITAGPLPPPSPPARLILATVTRRNEHSPLARIKSLNYLDNILARQEAQRAGADDALLRNTAGLIADSTVATLFALLDGALITPPIADGALPGIMRGQLLALGMATERSLPPARLIQAEALLLTNSLGLRMVKEIIPTAASPGWSPRSPLPPAIQTALAAAGIALTEDSPPP